MRADARGVTPLCLVVAACGARPPAEAPRVVAINFATEGAPWSLSIAGATHTEPDGRTQRFTTRAWTIEVVASPAPRTLADELALRRGADPGLGVLHQQAGDLHDPRDWALVTQSHGQICGGVAVHGPMLAVRCTFELASRSSWREPLEACETLVPLPGAESEAVLPGT